MNKHRIPDNSKTLTRETQAEITPQIALEMLKQGNERFLNGEGLDRNFERQITKTSTGQYPYAIILSCIDSRIPTEIIFDQGIGDLFNARIAGNFVNEDILGSMEFACKLAGAKLIVVMGHTSCGAVKGACDHAKLGNLTQMLYKIMPAVDAVDTKKGEDRSSQNIDFVNQVAEKNVELTIENIHSKSKVLQDLYEAKEIDIIGAMYDVENGMVKFVENN